MLTRATQSRKEFPIRSALIFLFRDRLVPRNKSLVREVSFCSESTTSPCGLCTGWSALRIYMELFPVCIMRIPGKGKVCKYMTKSLPCGLVVWAWVRSMEELPPRSLARSAGCCCPGLYAYGTGCTYSTVQFYSMDRWLNFARSPTSRDILNALILTTVCACGDAAIINFFF